MIAVFCGHAKLVNMLLLYGANLSLCNDDGNRALDLVCHGTADKRKYDEIVEMLCGAMEFDLLEEGGSVELPSAEEDGEEFVFMMECEGACSTRASTAPHYCRRLEFELVQHS